MVSSTKRVFECGECGYRGSRFKLGRCPACDSIRVNQKGTSDFQKQPSSPLRLLFCCGLWVIFAVVLYHKLVGLPCLVGC